MRAVLVLFLVLLTAACGGQQSFVDGVRVNNPTRYSVDVAASGTDSANQWLGLGRVPPDSERTFDRIVDQGPQWTFRFSYLDQQVVKEVGREQVVGDAAIEVPESLAQRLRDAGIAPRQQPSP